MRGAIVSVFGLLLVGLCVADSVAAEPFTGKPPAIGDEHISPRCVALDDTGNRYVAGSYRYAGTDFDPGPGVQNRAPHALGGSLIQPFITKFDANGRWVWTQTFGGSSGPGFIFDFVTAITVADGTVYAVGLLTSDNAGFGGLGTIGAPAGTRAAFVIALDAATGSPRTAFNGTGAQIIAGDTGRAIANAVAVTGKTLYVGGAFAATGFGIGGNGAASSTDTSSDDGFVAALDAATGAPALSFSGGGIQTLGGTSDEEIWSFALNATVLYAAGSTLSDDFGVGGTGKVASGGTRTAFVVALEGTTGAALTSFGGDGIVTFGAADGDSSGWGVAYAAGAVYLTGDTQGSGAKIDGTGPAFPTIGAGSDVFVMALDGLTGAPRTVFAGGVQFFGSTSGTASALGDAIGATASAVYVAGYFAAGGSDGAGIGGAGAVEQDSSFVLALDAATGGALTGFSGDGVQTMSRRSVSTFRSTAQALALLGASDDTYLGPASAAMQIPNSGAFLLLLDAATGAPLNMNVDSNGPPAFTAPVVATPNPTVAGKPVKFKAPAADPDRDRFGLRWEFGDGTSSTAKSPTKTYSAAGPYDVAATVTDRFGNVTDTAVLRFVVLPADAAYFDVGQATVSLNFRKSGRDAITVSGQIPLPDGTDLTGKSLEVDFGGVARTFVVDVAGKSPRGAESASVKPPRGGVARFDVRLTRGDHADLLADEGMTDAKAAGVYAPVDVSVTFDGTPYLETVPLFYTNKNGKAGTAR